MEKIQFDIEIHAPKEKVWEVLWNDETYRQWTSAFCEGSYAKSDWQQGSPIQFLDPKGNGMFSVIETHIPNRQMTFKHLGELHNYEEQNKDWAGATEAYYLSGDDNTTQLHLELDASNEAKKYFEDTFPKALQTVKQIAEQP